MFIPIICPNIVDISRAYHQGKSNVTRTNMALYLTLAIICVGIILFVKEYFSIDTTSILIMALFIVSGVLSPEEGFAGFNHPATLTVGCMFVVSSAVFKSGLIESRHTFEYHYLDCGYVYHSFVFSFLKVC